ncbi:CHAT domain-containing tetratricopeptide repeat protein [Tenacibaculum sp. 190524A02b]|uniref:CHAT domain-containing protein n=1 Tax=Tenacibaculum vairaonense TaxID=3137860 RepID=UPI0032B27736
MNCQKKTSSYTNKQIDSILSSFKVKDTIFIEKLHDIAISFYRKKDFNTFLKYTNLEVENYERLQILNTKYINALYNQGNIYYFLKNINKSIKSHLKVVSLNINLQKTALSYYHLAMCYQNKGELYKSVKYHEKSIQLFEKTNQVRHLTLSYILTAYTLAQINTLEELNKGLLYLKKADKIIKDHPKLASTLLLKNLNNTYGNIYISEHLNNFKKARYYYNKNIKLGIEKKDEDILSNSFVNLGELYLNNKKDSSLYFLKKVLSLKTDNIRRAEAYRNIANFYINKKDFNSALKNIENSLNQSFKNNNNQLVFEARNIRYIIKALNTKTNILINLHLSSNQEKNYLNEALKTINTSDAIVKNLISNSTETDTKLLWRNDVSKTYALGAYIAYLLESPSLLFKYTEKNKAFLLTQTILENSKLEKLPEEIIQKDFSFREKILSLEYSTIENENYSLKKDSLFDLKITYQKFKDSIQKINPEYLNTQKDIQQVSLTELQKQLDDNTVVLSYITNPTEINDEDFTLGLLVTNKYTETFLIKSNEKTFELLNQYKKLISKPLTLKKEFNTFKDIAHQLYIRLFPSDKIQKTIANKNIVIVPDVSFENIPFEALNTNKNEIHYLIENTDINYVYSISSTYYNKKIGRKTSTNFIGFAPVNFEKLSPLSNSLKEIETAKQLLNGEIFINNKATKQNFFANSSNSKIIHLATHANSTNNPVIHFAKDSIQLHELYTYKNNADLVVLSACQTNVGEIKKGEGVFSLARGFFHGGANSVISSLWNVNDKASSKIMTSFYQNLKNKQSKVTALNNAKRLYLKKHSLSEKSPYYWASFILLGDTKPSIENSYTLIYSLLFVSFLAFLFFSKKKGNKIKNDEQMSKEYYFERLINHFSNTTFKKK